MTSFTLWNGGIGPHLFIVLYLSCSGTQKIHYQIVI